MLKPPSILKKDSSLVCSDIQNNCNLGKPYIPEHKHLMLVNLIASLNRLDGFILIRVSLSAWNKTLVSGRAIIVLSYEYLSRLATFLRQNLSLFLVYITCLNLLRHVSIVYTHGKNLDSLVSFVYICSHTLQHVYIKK